MPYYEIMELINQLDDKIINLKKEIFDKMPNDKSMKRIHDEFKNVIIIANRGIYASALFSKNR